MFFSDLNSEILLFLKRISSKALTYEKKRETKIEKGRL